MSGLNGFGILVTRPEDKAGALCQLIDEAGGKAMRLPLLEVEPVAREAEGVQSLFSLGNVDWLIFVSTNAVKYTLGLVDEGALGLIGPRIAAIGQATADALEAAGLQVDLVPKPQFNSEALLAMPQLAEVRGQRIVIVRGEGGRELIADTLRARGAEVAYAEVYRRVASNRDVAQVIDDWRSGGIQVVTLTSGEALQNLISLLGEQDRSLLLATPMVVVSERIAHIAEEIGCLNVVTAPGPSDEDVLQAVVETVQERLKTLSKNGDNTLAEEDKEIQPEITQSDLAVEPAIAATPIKAKKSHFGAWLGYMSLVFVLLLAVGGFFLLQELRSKQEGLGGELNKGDQQMLEITRQITGLQSEIGTLHSQLATIESRVTTEDSKFERQVAEQGSAFAEKLDSARADLAASIQHIQRQMNQSRGDLMVADAEYLLSVANQKLHLVGDVKAVIAMMEAADQRLYDSGDPAAFKVREALAEEITLLKSMAPVDMVGSSAKLLVLESKVKSLPLFLPHSEVRAEDRRLKAAAPEPSPLPVEDKHGVLDNTLKDLKDLVTVRHSDRPINAILLPEEVAAIRQVMLLRLEMSRAALLRGDQALLESNIDSALSWLQENFDREATAVQEANAELKTLRALKIQIPFPDVSKSLSLVRNIERLRVETEKNQSSPKTPVQGKPISVESPELPPVIPTPESVAEPPKPESASEAGAKP